MANPAHEARGPGPWLASALLFASGFAGLVYQVSWMRELGFLFGNGAYAVSTTLAAFFLGIAAGSAAFGGVAARTRRPLLGYAGLEIGVALAALLYFGLLDAFAAVYEPLFQRFGNAPRSFVAAKFVLALGVLFPPAFFMGGTLPMMSQYRVRRRTALGTTGAVLYAVNTLGAAAGAFATPFWLVPVFGVRGAYTAALVTTLLVGLAAALLGRNPTAAAPRPDADTSRTRVPGTQGLRGLALLSGFATLALEVLWTRMFAQVVHNSVYTFAAILVTFLLCLAAGSGIAHALARRALRPERVLPVLLGIGALLVVATPGAFVAYTDGLATLGSQSDFAGYVLRVFGAAGLLLGLPVLWLGILFPYLLKASEQRQEAPGRVFGELAALNTLGGVAGSIAAGFFMLEFWGLWTSVFAIALLYAAVAVATAWPAFGGARAGLAAVAMGVLLALAFDPMGSLPRVAEGRDGERVLEVLEGAGASITVVEGGRGRRIKHNNHYGLGGSGDRNQEARQAHWPLALHPAPRSVYFLGMGTGITAGAALQHPLDRVLVAELDAQVTEASARYFSRYTNGLFDDPRAEVRSEDGRNLLRGSPERFDVIVADLFLPWKAGVGSLYSREHYTAARERLNESGLYAQWLLLVQFSEEEFAAVARTMLEVFPRVTLWRANERVTHPLVLLLGERDPNAFEPAAIDARIASIAPTVFDNARVAPEHRAVPDNAARLLYGYAGNLSVARDALPEAPINTDDRPFVEYSAPVTHREKRGGEARALIGGPWVALLDRIFDAAPPDADPALAATPKAWRLLPRSGLANYRSRVLERHGDAEGAAAARREAAESLERALAAP